MHYPALVLILVLILASCDNFSRKETMNIAAEQFVLSFYSFNADSLSSVLSLAEASRPGILYYQKWAECGNYVVIRRGEMVLKNDSVILVPVTVKDDLIGALELDMNVTDTFHITFRDGRIRSVETSSNDPAMYYEAKEWVKKNRPELVEKQCEGIWESGPTPCDCVKGMIEGFREFSKNRP